MPRVGLEKLEPPEPGDLERAMLDMLVREMHSREDTIALNKLTNRTTESMPIDVIPCPICATRKSILVDVHGRNLWLE